MPPIEVPIIVKVLPGSKRICQLIKLFHEEVGIVYRLRPVRETASDEIIAENLVTAGEKALVEVVIDEIGGREAVDEDEAFIAVPLELVAGTTVRQLNVAALVGPARGVIESEAFGQERVPDLSECVHVTSFKSCKKRIVDWINYCIFLQKWEYSFRLIP